MFAWKQQSFKECVTAHWSSGVGIDNKRASSIVPKLRTCSNAIGRGAFCSAEKVCGDACWSVQKSKCRNK